MVLGGSLGSSSPCPTRRQEKLPSVSPPAATAGLEAWGSPLREGAADVSFTGSPDMAGGGVGELVLPPSAGEVALGVKMEAVSSAAPPNNLLLLPPKENLGNPASFTGKHRQTNRVNNPAKHFSLTAHYTEKGQPAVSAGRML